MNIIIKRLNNHDKFAKWGEQLQTTRKDEAVETMKQEGTVFEGFYAFEMAGQKYAIGAQIIDEAKKAAGQQHFVVDDEHQAMRKECLGEIIPAEVIYELENL